MARVSKRVRKSYDGFDRGAVFALDQALAKVKELASAKFDETVDISINLNIDTKKAEQNLRGVVSLPHGTGKKIRVAAFVGDDQVKEAKSAGADVVGGDSLVDSIRGGNIDFDRCVATPDMMDVVGKVARVLGPKGLMPNPKLGTVDSDFASAIKRIKAGQVEYRAEKNGIIHAGLGKVSFSVEHLVENVKCFVDEVVKTKPGTVKGVYLRRVVLSSTMGPALDIDVSSV